MNNYKLIMLTIKKTFYFNSAHYLPNYEGKCKNLHGHTYKLIVELKPDNSKPCDNVNGFIIDFSDFKKIINEILDEKYDHKNLNDFMKNPTAEELIIKIYNDIVVKIKDMNILVYKLELYEGENSSVIYYN